MNPAHTAGKLLVLGNLAAGKSTVARRLGRETGWPLYGIDDARREMADGSPAGEARAWAGFLAAAQSPRPGILECTGGGPFVHLLRLALVHSSLPWGVVFVRTTAAECVRRVRLRGLDAPYPDFGVPVDEVVERVERELGRLIGTLWPVPLSVVEDGGSADSLHPVAHWVRGGLWPSATA